MNKQQIDAVSRLSVIAAILLSAALVGCDTSDRGALKSATDVYAQAWARRDVDRILALHADDTEFVLFVDGTERATGKPAVRAAFTSILRDHPNYAAKADGIAFGDNFAVVQYRIQMSPPAPFALGRHRFTPTESPYEVRAVDILRFKDGLVTSKQTYIDSEAAHNNSKAVE